MERLTLARRKVNDEISGNRRGGHYAAGISAEGYVGGYRDALSDVEAMLTHGCPGDLRGYWRMKP